MKSRIVPLLGVLMIAAAAGLAALTFTPGSSWKDGGLFGGRGQLSGTSISMQTAQQNVQAFVDRSGNADLRIDEMMEFDQNFYALIKERSTGIGAFELLVNKQSGSVVFEPGPDMMWNSKYSVMGAGGNMGARGGMEARSAGAAMSVNSERATQVAQAWLDRNRGGNSAGTPDAFYGYYTFHYLKAGRIAGMLSVNGSTGQVWFHTWHGAFIQVLDLGA